MHIIVSWAGEEGDEVSISDFLCASLASFGLSERINPYVESKKSSKHPGKMCERNPRV
jgi:hypothetical protein